MKRLLTFILIFTVMCSLFCITAFASQENTLNTQDDTNTQESFFTLAYQAAIEHSEKILSALAAVASVILALAYKKGLIPSLKLAIEKLCESVSKVKNASENGVKMTSNLLEAAEDRLENMKNALESIDERLIKLI